MRCSILLENNAKLFKLNFQEGRNFSTILIEACGALSLRVSRCSRLMAVYSPGFNDRWPCKRALAMHRPSNSSVLFPPEMQRRVSENFRGERR